MGVDAQTGNWYGVLGKTAASAGEFWEGIVKNRAFMSTTALIFTGVNIDITVVPVVIDTIWEFFIWP